MEIGEVVDLLTISKYLSLGKDCKSVNADLLSKKVAYSFQSQKNPLFMKKHPYYGYQLSYGLLCCNLGLHKIRNSAVISYNVEQRLPHRDIFRCRFIYFKIYRNYHSYPVLHNPNKR